MTIRILGLAAALAVATPIAAFAQASPGPAATTAPLPTTSGMPTPMASGMHHMKGHHRHHRHHHHGCRDPKTMKFESCKTPGAVPVTASSAPPRVGGSAPTNQ